MNIKGFLLGCVLAVASVGATSAATVDAGDVTNGASVTDVLSVRTLDFIDFTIDVASGFMLEELEITVSSNVAGSNLSPGLGLYKDGLLVATVAAVNQVRSATLTLAGLPALVDGDYVLAVGGWRSFFTADIAGARSTANFNNGSYTVAFNSTIAAVPLPAGGLLLLGGLAALAFARRKAA